MLKKINYKTKPLSWSNNLFITDFLRKINTFSASRVSRNKFYWASTIIISYGKEKKNTLSWAINTYWSIGRALLFQPSRGIHAYIYISINCVLHENVRVVHPNSTLQLVVRFFPPSKKMIARIVASQHFLQI